MRYSFAVMAALAACAGSAMARPVVFQSDFESGTPAGWGGSFNIESVQGLTSLGFAGQFSRNAVAPASATTLSLSNLSAHTTVSLSFLLATIDSWDGIGGNPGPDSFEVVVDGTTVFSHVFASASGSSDYNAPIGGFLGAGQYGFNSWNDYGWNMGLEPSLQNIPHTASTLLVEFRAAGPGWQGGDDESWGIDDVVVNVDRVPTPGAMTVAAAGVVMMLRRRR